MGVGRINQIGRTGRLRNAPKKRQGRRARSSISKNRVMGRGNSAVVEGEQESSNFLTNIFGPFPVS